MDRIEYEFDVKEFMRDIRDTCGKGTSLRQLEIRTGISASTLSRMDGGKLPDLQTFMMICGRLELNPSEYFERVVWTRKDQE